MAQVVRTLTPAHTTCRERLSSSHIPFLDNHPNAFSTCFQDHFKPYSVKKPECAGVPTQTQTQVCLKDLKHIPEYHTETLMSFQAPPPPLHINHIQTLRKFITNFQMQTDPGQVTFCTTNQFHFQHKPLQPLTKAAPPTSSLGNRQHMEKFPESTQRTSYTTHQHGSTVRQDTMRHDSDFPTIRGDGNACNFVSHYNDIFCGASSQRTEPVKKHCSMVVMGDQRQSAERETTHMASFRQPAVCRSAEELKLNPNLSLVSNVHLGHSSKDSWSSISRESYSHHKTDPVVLVKKNPNSSSLALGETDPQAGTGWMSNTTNRICYPKWTLPQCPGLDTTGFRTKSHVQFSSAHPHPSDFSYVTTSSQHFHKKPGPSPPGPAPQRPSAILTGPDRGPRLSTSQVDFIPLKTSRRSPPPPRQMTNVRFPVTAPDFSTTHSADYTAKSSAKQPPARSQYCSHFDIC